ncbi:MAG: hypothetical protein QNJ63_09980 [Calothrix sp. MO_192.B10]|nr:hypothetical protein [Calothrix sp. MO_192.B10]
MIIGIVTALISVITTVIPPQLPTTTTPRPSRCGQPFHEEARLLYIAMTRAIDQLILSGDRSSEFFTRIESALGKVSTAVSGG